jgi:cytochrome c oxidase subunit 2
MSDRSHEAATDGEKEEEARSIALSHIKAADAAVTAILATDGASIARWIKHNQDIKPGNLMPAFDIFSESELLALSRYLASLR